MKYKVKHICGCTTEHNIVGISYYRSWKLDRLTEEKCYKCKNKEMIQKMLDSGDYYVEEVSYKIYKNNGLIAVQDTYNNDTKTIQVIVRKE